MSAEMNQPCSTRLIRSEPRAAPSSPSSTKDSIARHERRFHQVLLALGFGVGLFAGVVLQMILDNSR
jgi:hypothetical protein